MNPQEKLRLILLLNVMSWMKDMNRQKSKQLMTEKVQLMAKQAFLRSRSRTLRCELLVWLVDRSSRPRRRSTSIIPSI